MREQRTLRLRLRLLGVALIAAVASTAAVEAVNLTVVGSDGAAVLNYRWLVEEDATYHVQPGVPDPYTLAVDFHRSAMPVVAKGTSADLSPLVSLSSAGYYMISVLPASGYSNGGVLVAPGQSDVTVVVNKLPFPTAQITIRIFQDISPINNIFDFGEVGLEGFEIVLEDAGGRYGMSAGTQMLDAFANPLGTTYQRNAAGDYVLDADGLPAVDMMGMGVFTDVDGLVTIKNLAPGKYGISAIPPAGQSWQQTSTIEGKKVIDAWVKANEPPYFAEFGPPGPHVSIGFVQPFFDATALTGGSTIAGQVVNLHLSRPPDYAFYNGAPFPHTTPWIGLNLGAAGGRGVYAGRANDDGSFSIPNVPPGDYQLVVWDDNMDLIFATKGLTVNGDGSCNGLGGCNLGDVPVFQWFSRLENWVFNDINQNGFWDDGEPGIPEQAINLRWRDGTMYQSFPTDGEGFVPFDEVFPFFSWLVAEVDFARLKATGVTVVVDNGGAIDATDPWTAGGHLSPQPQSENGGLPYRTETGPVLTQAFQGFIGQTSVMMWGKTAYGPGENGGISGIVYYATTRAEDDPAYAAAEPWEPGIADVTVNLYDSTGSLLLNSVTTDNWDANVPTGCQGEQYVFQGRVTDCFDGLRNFNQIRPGTFDGGYAFTSYWDPYFGAPGAVEVEGLPAGQYVVEVIPPAGYEIVKEEDRNVDFGDSYVPSTQLLPPECVGAAHQVPPYLALFPDQQVESAFVWENGVYVGDNPANFRPLCDRKLVRLSSGQNTAADFFLFTEVPIAGHIIGFILDDTANEFDPTSPHFGEKYAPPWLPVSIRDWTGREIARTYSDQFGVYNALVPSTYTTNLPAPSGMSPSMITTCMNARTLPDGTVDPFHNPQYSEFCYTFQYMPGTTTYLDTPVVPVAAFAGPDQFPLDCEFANGTPRIYSVTNGANQGPFVPVADGSQTLTITSMGSAVSVPNPAYDGLGGSLPKTITRDYSFGSVPGTVTVGGVPLLGVTWSADTITGIVAPGTVTGELVVTRGDNDRSTISSVTVQVGLRQGAAVGTVAPGQSIQDAIDVAGANDLILVAPGTYNELVIMWKPVQLQGWGEGSTTIHAVKTPAEKLQAWRLKVQALVTQGDVDLLPGQEAAFLGIEPEALFTEEGAGIIVLAKANGNRAFDRSQNRRARIDGFTITGADTGGGIVVNGYADYLDISNNRIVNNSGLLGGGIRLGHPALIAQQGNNLFYPDASNDFVRIRFNHITQNGNTAGAGGGVSLCNGSDGYTVSSNYVCGNFALADGGGIAHYGLSDGGLIRSNTVIFNESFNQGTTVSGGGLFVGGQPPFGCPIDPITGLPDPACLADPLFTLSPGSGSVKVVGNVIQGNLAGAGDGGGLRAERVNGQELEANQNRPERWYRLGLFNNIIVNNVAGLAGGGISLQDVVRARIIHNTIANNDSTATAGEAFTPGVPNQSNPQPAGIVARAHSGELAAVLPGGEAGFANAELVDNIVWHNRSFYFFGDLSGDTPIYGLLPNVAVDPPVFDDLAVLPAAAGALTPQASVLSGDPDPMFVAEYYNGDRGAAIAFPEVTTAIQAPPAFDEGGNFIRLRFGPLTLNRVDTGEPYGDYHLQLGSPAVDAGLDLTGSFPELLLDIDGEARPAGAGVDIGADETGSVLLKQASANADSELAVR